MITILHGDCLTHMAALRDAGERFAAICTDPPYGLSFMNAKWDAPDNIAFRPDTWRLALDVLEPGGMLACFGGSRTHHRMMVAIEDAGFEIRDCVMWLYGTGFPKSESLLKPAYEPIVLARKPGPLRPLAIDACRIPSGADYHDLDVTQGGNRSMAFGMAERKFQPATGRWPANVIHDGSDEVLAAFAAFGERESRPGKTKARGESVHCYGKATQSDGPKHNDTGTSARFFMSCKWSEEELLARQLAPSRFYYSSKASKADRAGSKHPTVKPISLMRYLCKLVTPPGGRVLDMFAGSGTTGVACQREGFDCVLVEADAEYVETIRKRFGADFQLEAAD